MTEASGSLHLSLLDRHPGLRLLVAEYVLGVKFARPRRLLGEVASLLLTYV